MKKREIMIFIGMVTVFLAVIVSLNGGHKNPTGLSVSSGSGCCEAMCQMTDETECPGKFHDSTTCDQLTECNVGCCVDKEKYCFGNYLKGNCEKSGYKFVSKMECNNYPICLMPAPSNSLRGYTGYPNAYGQAAKEGAFAEPMAAKAGDTFKIQFYNLDEIRKIVDVLVEDGNTYSNTVELFDDGIHQGDRVANDSLYEGQWDSSDLSISGIQKINLTTMINGQKSKYQNFLILSPTSCVPMMVNWQNPDSRKDIIFIDFGDANQFMLFEGQIGNIINAFFTANLTESTNMNFYKIINSLNTNNPSNAKSKAIGEAPFSFDSSQDIVIFLDNEYDDCEQSSGFIRTNPNIFFDREMIKNITTIGEFLNNFCELAMTEKELNDSILGPFMGPNITITSPINESTYTTHNVNVLFGIKDNKGPITYEVYLDEDSPNMIMDSGTIVGNEETISKTFTIPDGAHELWIEADDADDNWAKSESIFFTINVSNFVINALTFDSRSYSELKDVNFTISHEANPQINYHVFVDNSIICSGGPIQKNTLVYCDSGPSLLTGDHSLLITATDNLGNFASSKNYTIRIT
jgi:hypothetical protein